MTAFLVGLAGGQILLGPISDSKGRRGILLGGTVLFTVFSVICALAPTVEVLNVARVLQGASGAAGLFTYIGSSTYVFQEIYELSALQYSLIFGGNAIGMVIAGILFGNMSKRMRVNNLLLVGIALLILARPWLGAGEAETEENTNGTPVQD